MSFEELRAAVLALPPDELCRLGEVVSERIERDGLARPFTEAEAAELERRWQAHLDNPAAAIPWDDAERRLEERYGDSRAIWHASPGT